MPSDDVKEAVNTLIDHARNGAASSVRFPDILRWRLNVEAFCGQVRIVIELDGAEVIDNAQKED